MQHAPISSTGPQIGYAVVVSGVVIKSSERRPALALPDIAVQIGQLNVTRYAAGLPPLEAPHSPGQLIPLYAGDNPRIDALLAGQAAPAQRIGCSSSAEPIAGVHRHTHNNLLRMAAGYSARAVRS